MFDIVDKMQKQGVIFKEGLTSEEFSKVETIYGIKFPYELSLFISQYLPISKGFYDWSDFSKQNIQYISDAIALPKKQIIELADEVYWSDVWGDEPPLQIRENIIISKVTNAPTLAPVFAHRYIPCVSQKRCPIFSIHGVDIICYGQSLTDYLEIEFGNKKQIDIDFSNLGYVDFWSDLL